MASSDRKSENDVVRITMSPEQRAQKVVVENRVTLERSEMK